MTSARRVAGVSRPRSTVPTLFAEVQEERGQRGAWRGGCWGREAQRCQDQEPEGLPLLRASQRDGGTVPVPGGTLPPSHTKPARPSRWETISMSEAGSQAVPFSPGFFPAVTSWTCCLRTRLPGRYDGVRKHQEPLTGKMLLPTALQKQGSGQTAGNLQLTASLKQ